MVNIYQIKISLKNIQPKVWRRILVKSNTPLLDFHYIIQTTMGWTNSHLHRFRKNKMYFSIPLEDEDFDEFDRGEDYLKAKLKISDLLITEKDKIIYDYDFGDDWSHEIILEKVLNIDINTIYPKCIKGQMCCPPEDCGGDWGYENILQIIQNKKHSEYKDTIEWLGGGFDPEYFDLEEINEGLQEENYGCFDMLF
jgi:hypothetical protein